MFKRSKKHVTYNKLLLQNILVLFVFGMFIPNITHAAEVSLAWDRPDDSRIIGYKIYSKSENQDFGTEPAKIISDPSQTTCTIEGLQEGQIYGFTSTSYDALGNESDYSNEVYYNVPVTDSDNDGISDSDETSIYNTDPNNPDTDNDGISDGDELSYWGDNWDRDDDNDELINLLDSDADNDGINDGTEITQGSDPSQPDINKSNDINISYGEISIDHEWTYVEINKPFKDPVIIASPLSYNDSDPGVIRIRNLTPDSFEIRIQEYDYQDDQHGQENVGIVIIDSGQYTLSDGSTLEANSFETNNTFNSFYTNPFDANFNNKPVVLTSILSYNGKQAVTGRIKNITTESFEYCMQEQDANLSLHTTEKIGYIAWEPSKGNINGYNFEAIRTQDIVTDIGSVIEFEQEYTKSPIFLADMQTINGSNCANIRMNDKTNTSTKVHISEEQSQTSETMHTTESVGYIVLESTNNVPADDSNVINNIEYSELTINDEWSYINLKNSYYDPVIIANPMSMNDMEPGVIRIRNLTSTGFEIRIQEYDYQDDNHENEKVSIIIIESGKYELNDGSMIEANHFNTNTSFGSTDLIDFTSNFKSKPIVLSSVLSYNGKQAVTGRINNITTEGFEYCMQEQDANPSLHTDEMIGYIAWELSSGNINGYQFEANRTNNVVTDELYKINFDHTYSSSPVFVADMQTTDGANCANVRMTNKNKTSVQVRISEEQSENIETMHTNEIIGYIVFEPVN